MKHSTNLNCTDWKKARNNKGLSSKVGMNQHVKEKNSTESCTKEKTSYSEKKHK